jgi:hypothetical protein
MTFTGRVRRRCSSDTPSVLSVEAGDHVGAYKTVGRFGGRPSDARTAARLSDPSTRASTFGMPIRRIAGLLASSAPDAMQLFSRRRFTKNNRCHASNDSVGASNPYLPPTP